MTKETDMPDHNPFCLHQKAAYAHWRTLKLAHYPTCFDQLVVPLSNLSSISQSEHAKLKTCIDKTNMVICSAPNPPDKTLLRELGKHFGLTRLDANIYAEEDAITALQVQTSRSRQQAFIPYTDKALSWHTDGYYNPLHRQIRAMALYCASAAVEGGDNSLLDPEIAYLLMRDENPAFIRALSDPTVLTIPAHIDDAGANLRPAQTGPVFSVIDGQLHMRYSHRKRNIVWHTSELVEQARAFLSHLFDHCAYRFNGKLAPGQALLCNNVLHNRTAFKDNVTHKRCIYRARYYDRISG